MKKTHDLLAKNIQDFEQLITELTADPESTKVEDGDAVLEYRLATLQNQFQFGMLSFFQAMDQVRELEEIEYDEASQYFIQKRGKVKLGNTPEFLEDWSEYLALKAAREIYKKLDAAKIDLIQHENIEDGQLLELYVLKHEGQSDKPKKYLITSFKVMDLGWNLSLSESLILIDRINEDLAPEANRNSTNFKPSPGVSLLWKYNGPINLGKRPVNKKGEVRYGFWSWLKPSIGINTSYLDFTDDDQFEIGAGPILGVFNNKLFFTWGYNFNVKGTAATYMGIGLSFTNVVEDIKKLKDN